MKVDSNAQVDMYFILMALFLFYLRGPTVSAVISVLQRPPKSYWRKETVIYLYSDKNALTTYCAFADPNPNRYINLTICSANSWFSEGCTTILTVQQFWSTLEMHLFAPCSEKYWWEFQGMKKNRYEVIDGARNEENLSGGGECSEFQVKAHNVLGKIKSRLTTHGRSNCLVSYISQIVVVCVCERFRYSLAASWSVFFSHVTLDVWLRCMDTSVVYCTE